MVQETDQYASVRGACTNYVSGHIPGAYWLLGSDLRQLTAPHALPLASRYVVTCGTGQLAPYMVNEVERLTGKLVYVFVLNGGNPAWKAANLPLEQRENRLMSPRIDRYRRPYEGIEVPKAVMLAYLDLGVWFGCTIGERRYARFLGAITRG